MVDTELKNRIELLFFDPLKIRDEYIKRFNKIYPESKHYAYSPLYDLQAQIVELDRREMWLPVVLLLNVLLEGIAANILTTDRVREGVDLFFERFTSLTKVESVLLREFRNAREHNFSQFTGRLKQDKRRPFETLFESLPDTEKTYRNMETYFKMTFSASLGGSKVAEYQYNSYNKERNYYLISPHINPMYFRATIFSGVEKLKKSVEEESVLQENIKRNLKVTNWTHIIYSAAESSNSSLGFDTPLFSK